MFDQGIYSIPIKKIYFFYVVAFGEIHRKSPIMKWVFKWNRLILICSWFSNFKILQGNTVYLILSKPCLIKRLSLAGCLLRAFQFVGWWAQTFAWQKLFKSWLFGFKTDRVERIYNGKSFKSDSLFWAKMEIK